MDPLTIVGIIIVLATTFGGMVMGGIAPVPVFFGSVSSIIIVLGGTMGATLAGGTIADMTNVLKAMVKAFIGGKTPDSTVVIGQMVSFAETARREGLLALEDRAEEIEDDFFRRGLQMAIDGTDPEMVRDILETDIEAMEARHKSSSDWVGAAAGYAPAFGVAGTVIGLIDMLGNMSDPDALGPAIAVAFITTLWGVFLANYIFGPIAAKLKKASGYEVAYRTMIVEGVLAIQAGTNPRSVSDRLGSRLTPGQRAALDAERESA